MDKDDVPKLREEKRLEELYDDLKPNTLIPMVYSSESSSLVNSIELNVNNSVDTRIKQIIFKGKTTLEQIKVNPNRTRYRKNRISLESLTSPFPIEKHNHAQCTSSHNVSNTKDYSDNFSHSFDENKTPYSTKYDPINIKQPEVNIRNALAHLSPNLASFQTEYDMDEHDFLYMQYLNEKYADGKFTEELFELLITVLEIEWFNLEKMIPPRNYSAYDSSINNNNNVQYHMSQSYRNHYDLYGSDDGIYPNSEQTCAICDGAYSDNNNAIVFCDGCDIAVHQECYGIVFIPEGQWLCRKCLFSKNMKVNCLLCPSHTGAFKQTDVGKWAHVLCSLWIPELYFANVNYMEPIEGLEYIAKSRWKLVCYICEQRVGACIQCSNKNCFRSYHVTCAKRAGLYLKFNGVSIPDMAINQYSHGHVPKTFCDKHSPNGPSSNASLGIMKVRRYLKYLKEKELRSSEEEDLDILQNEDENYRKTTNTGISLSNINYQTDYDNIRQGIISPNDSSEIDQWKTHNGTPIAPNYFATLLQKICAMYSLPKAQNISVEMCKYWSMKREFRKGAPLVRKYDFSTYNTLTIEEIKDRINFSDSLLDDLMKLKNIINLIGQRTKIEDSIHDNNDNITAIIERPTKWLMRKNVLDKWTSSACFKNIIKEINSKANYSIELNNIFEQLISKEFESIEDVKQIVYEFFEILNKLILNLNTIPRSLINNINKSKVLFNELFIGLENNNCKKFLNQDFEIDKENYANIKERPWNGKIVLKDEGLSDVEELGSKEMRFLGYLMSKTSSSRK
ncbi:hypothetical protein TBLA_0F01530 [Henningerozyma blattae CBS 6284]|uniref:PHD-type domain-containing protein n=1 Tax=Henningerozyma blattae (strain ATCC 34711 / CBS 6284 / DSM 70876 / NBRC 10599 / NRRL Y-10934 / UCD 77-7) TaxID=1071380 RepID=I2H5P3_HENB6|nr:hypothetical protein TBLA_0F01530 [Tetrapisispora blattae CBS 6284]CCH61695.1 hypothetical protein TBLA_0F01530 [Tetrapisispora blattae CBS 6284]